MAGALAGAWACSSPAEPAEPAAVDVQALLAGIGLTYRGPLSLTLERDEPLPARVPLRAIDLRRADQLLLRLRVFSAADQAAAAALAVEQERLFLALYDPSLPPYPELLTKEAACPDEYRPQRRNHPAGPLWLTGAGQRLGFGVCSADQVVYGAALALLRCPGATFVIRAEAFAPGAGRGELAEALLRALACSEPGAPAAPQTPLPRRD